MILSPSNSMQTTSRPTQYSPISLSFPPNYSRSSLIIYLSLCWCRSNGVLLAADEHKILHLGHGNPHCTYCINDYPIPKDTESVRDHLGIHYSPSLKFDAHMLMVQYLKIFPDQKFSYSHPPFQNLC
jgi:hypothetical protein